MFRLFVSSLVMMFRLLCTRDLMSGLVEEICSKILMLFDHFVFFSFLKIYKHADMD